MLAYPIPRPNPNIKTAWATTLMIFVSTPVMINGHTILCVNKQTNKQTNKQQLKYLVIIIIVYWPVSEETSVTLHKEQQTVKTTIITNQTTKQ